MQMETEISLKMQTHRIFSILRRNRGGTLVLSSIPFVVFHCILSQVSPEHLIQVKANSTLLYPAVKPVSIFPS